MKKNEAAAHKARVYHIADYRAFLATGQRPEWPKDYGLVASVGAFGLEDAYERTNTMGLPWWKNDRVTRLFLGHGCRSTSVGDVICFEGAAYIVEPTGFRWIGERKAN